MKNYAVYKVKRAEHDVIIKVLNMTLYNKLYKNVYVSSLEEQKRYKIIFHITQILDMKRLSK